MTRREWVRTFFIAVVAGLVVGVLATLLSGKPWVGIVVAALAWGVTEWTWRRLGHLPVRLRWPVQLLSNQAVIDDLGAQIETLMGTPLHRWPAIRQRVALLFCSLQAERG